MFQTVSLATDDTDGLADVRHRAPRLDDAGLDYGILTELAGFSIKLTWILGHGLLVREFADASVTPHRFSLLEIIGSNPGMQQTQLADALALSRPATSLGIDFWEDRGCVERRSTPQDRRSFRVYLTPKGKRDLARLRSQVRAADDALISGLTDAETFELRRLLKKIHG